MFHIIRAFVHVRISIQIVSNTTFKVNVYYTMHAVYTAQWRRKIVFYSEVGRVPEPGDSKTSLATTRQLSSRFIVYSPRVRD